MAREEEGSSPNESLLEALYGVGLARYSRGDKDGARKILDEALERASVMYATDDFHRIDIRKRIRAIEPSLVQD